MSGPNTMGGERPRNEHDFYATPPALARAICAKLRETLGTPTTVIEPSAGDGAFVRAAAATWLTTPIFAVEPNIGHAAATDEMAIWSAATWESFEWSTVPDTIGPMLIVGNPPFPKAEAHVRLALQRLGRSSSGGTRHVAFLLRASFLAGTARVGGIWREHPPRYVWHIAPRPSFTSDGKTDGAEYAVIVWKTGWIGPYEGGWLTWSRGE